LSWADSLVGDICFFFLVGRRRHIATHCISAAASDVYTKQALAVANSRVDPVHQIKAVAGPV